MAIDPNADNELLSAISSQQLGADPAAQAPAAPAEKPAAPAGDTNMDKAQTAASPKTEATEANEDPVVYKVDIDGNIRELTPKQIAETTKRYADLNYKHQTEIAPIKPAIDVLNKIMVQAKQDGVDISGDQLAAFLVQTLQGQANTKGVEFGAQSQNGQSVETEVERENLPVGHKSLPGTPDDFEAQLAQWEADNAVTLPPMYKNMAKQLSEARNQMATMGTTMQDLMAQMQGITSTAQTQMKEGKVAQNKAHLQTIANNLQSAQIKYGLEDAQEKDFMMFAGERGYSIEDFIDPALTERVVADFKAVKDTPEMERLRSINQRRQSFTGVTSPGAAGAGSTPTPGSASVDESFINDVATQHMTSRNMG